MAEQVHLDGGFMMGDLRLLPRSAFALNMIGTQRSVQIVDCDSLGIATVCARRGSTALLARRVLDRYSIVLPEGPQRVQASAVAFVATGPGRWLATSAQGSNGWANSLQQTLGDLASVCDQSNGYAVVRMSGPKARDTLAKLLPIDLHARAFAPGAVATTVASNISVTLWRLSEGGDDSPVYELAVPRSFAVDFWGALANSAAEFV